MSNKHLFRLLESGTKQQQKQAARELRNRGVWG